MEVYEEDIDFAAIDRQIKQSLLPTPSNIDAEKDADISSTINCTSITDNAANAPAPEKLGFFDKSSVATFEVKNIDANREVDNIGNAAPKKSAKIKEISFDDDYLEELNNFDTIDNNGYNYGFSFRNNNSFNQIPKKQPVKNDKFYEDIFTQYEEINGKCDTITDLVETLQEAVSTENFDRLVKMQKESDINIDKLTKMLEESNANVAKLTKMLEDVQIHAHKSEYMLEKIMGILREIKPAE